MKAELDLTWGKVFKADNQFLIACMTKVGKVPKRILTAIKKRLPGGVSITHYTNKKSKSGKSRKKR